MKRYFLSTVSAGVGLMLLAGLFGCPQMPPADGGNGTDGGNGGNGGNGDDGGGVANQVSMENISFDPDSITIEQGETVRWVNNDFVPHTVTSGNPGDSDAGSLFDSGTIDPGGSFEHAFTETGTFVYFCEIHPILMRDATVVVE